MFEIKQKKISGIFEIEVENAFSDKRGSLIRLYDNRIFSHIGVNMDIAEESIVRSPQKYTLRGLHVSLPPHMESKIIVSTRGKTLWISVDIRKGSKTFGKWSSTILSSEKNNMLYTEKGFAHGCVSLTDNAELLIKASEHFSDVVSSGILWNDTDLKINWKLNGAKPIISKEHEKYLSFKNFIKKHVGV